MKWFCALAMSVVLTASSEAATTDSKILRATFETGAPPPWQVPEPATVGLVLAGLAVLLRAVWKTPKR